MAEIERDCLLAGCDNPANVHIFASSCTPDVKGAYFDAGWTVDTAGVWHEPARGMVLHVCEENIGTVIPTLAVPSNRLAMNRKPSIDL
jgi:hypothetical protein